MKSTVKNMILSLTAIALVLGVVLALVHDLTEKPIAEAAQRQQQEALAEVLPPFTNNPVDKADTIAIAGTDRVAIVFPAENVGRYCGAAVMLSTMDGFSGEIEIMIGFDADKAVSGYKILKTAETPGLGAKAEEWFRSDIGHRSIIGTASEVTVAKDGGDIDAITAATITSRAFLGAVNTARSILNAYLAGASSADADTGASQKHKTDSDPQ